MNKITQDLMVLAALVSIGIATMTPAAAAHFSDMSHFANNLIPMWIRYC